MNLPVLRRTAAEVAAAAVYEMFPEVELLGGGETPSGFAYEFFFPHPVNPDTLPLIEERMRQIARERREVRTLEMVPFSAGELLKRDGHFSRLEDLEEKGDQELVFVFQMGSFHDLSSGTHLKNTAELSAFKLLTIEKVDANMRLTGSAHFSKPELKEFLKRLAAYQDPLEIGERKGLWLPMNEGLVWREKGLEFKKKAIEFLRRSVFQDAEEILSPVGASLHWDVARKMNSFPIQLAEVHGEEIQISSYFFSDFENRLISSLQSLGKTLKMLGFNYCLLLTGRKRLVERYKRALEKMDWKAEVEIEEGSAPEIDFRIEDGIERKSSVVRVCGVSGLVPPMEGITIAISVEKILALLLEKNLDARLNRI